MKAKPKILVLGAGSQAKVIADILQIRDEFELVGYVELGLDLQRIGQSILGAPILGSLQELETIQKKTGADMAALGIGNNYKREELYQSADRLGLELPALIHPSATISPSAQIGKGSVIAAQACVGVEAQIGRGCIINTAASVDHDCQLGSFVHIAVGVHLAGIVEVGDYVLFGAGSTAIPQSKIGKASTIGAGAAVIGEIPEHSLALGVPARIKPQPEAS